MASMIQRSDTDVAETLALFNSKGLDVAFLVPTANALEKSIMDATQSARAYLKAVGCHDYENQVQGEDAKLTLKAVFVETDRVIDSNASLYRPVTKSGDPRIWFSGLKNYAHANNLLAVLFFHNRLYVINCSRREILGSIHTSASPLSDLALKASKAFESSEANELFEKLRAIGARGFVKSLRVGDTGIGFTLETLLGISANTNRTPDFKGIEIKASRTTRVQNRVTLFSQVPNWRLSPIGSALNLLEKHGYEREGRKQLYHEMNALKPNSIGFILDVDRDNDWLKQNHIGLEKKVTHLVTWEFEKLRTALQNKHPATFWVKANSQIISGHEHFHYVEVVRTSAPKFWHFETLIEAGVVSVDYTLSMKGAKTRDHGYLFKIHPKNLNALFPPSKLASLI